MNTNSNIVDETSKRVCVTSQVKDSVRKAWAMTPPNKHRTPMDSNLGFNNSPHS
jgi:hypothetical protein